MAPVAPLKWRQTIQLLHSTQMCSEHHVRPPLNPVCGQSPATSLSFDAAKEGSALYYFLEVDNWQIKQCSETGNNWWHCFAELPLKCAVSSAHDRVTWRQISFVLGCFDRAIMTLSITQTCEAHYRKYDYALSADYIYRRVRVSEHGKIQGQLFGALTMGQALALSATISLCIFCMIQAAKHQSQTRLLMGAASSLEPEELHVLSAPSLAPSLPYPDSVPQNIVPTIPPAAMTGNPQETFSPLPSSTNPCSCFASRAPSCTPQCFFPYLIFASGTLGYVGAESDLFRKKCSNFCLRHSKRRCWIVKNPRIHSRCKRFAFLGIRSAPSCCFYLHCINHRRPRGRSRSWWKYTSALRAIRRACKQSTN